MTATVRNLLLGAAAVAALFSAGPVQAQLVNPYTPNLPGGAINPYSPGGFGSGLPWGGYGGFYCFALNAVPPVVEAEP